MADYSDVKIQHIERDIEDLKRCDKDIIRDMTAMKESHIETKIYIRQIQESQNKLSANFEAIDTKLDMIKNQPQQEYSKVKWAAVTFIVLYILSNILGFVKVFMG